MSTAGQVEWAEHLAEELRPLGLVALAYDPWPLVSDRDAEVAVTRVLDLVAGDENELPSRFINTPLRGTHEEAQAG